MKLVIVESPYGSTIQADRYRNVQYTHEACRDCLMRGESAWGSHIIWTQFLDDSIPEERNLGILAGLAWSRVADYHAFYTDRGWSNGMLTALQHCLDNQKAFRIRSLDHNKHRLGILPPKEWLAERSPAVQRIIESVMELYS